MKPSRSFAAIGRAAIPDQLRAKFPKLSAMDEIEQPAENGAASSERRAVD